MGNSDPWREAGMNLKKNFEEIMVKIFLNMLKTINPKPQEASQTLSTAWQKLHQAT
jgi:hypothetical protein